MDNYIFSALNCLKGFANKVLSCLNKYLNSYIIRNMVALNQFTANFVLGFKCRLWVEPIDFTSDLQSRLRTLYTQ